jgi:peptidyl-prolyl cis-trans isomerase C
MKKNALVPTFFILTVVAAIAGCDQLASFTASAPVKPQGTIIAKVDSYYITQEQLDKEIENLNAMNSLYFNTEAKKFTKEEKTSFLNETLIPRYLLFKAARQQKIDQQPASKEALFNYEVQVLSEEYLKRETGNITATNPEIEEFYNTYKDRFTQSEERRVREIMVPTEDEAKEILIDLLKGADFAATAQARSKAESAAKGGDCGYIKKGQLGGDYMRFSDTAFSLDKAQISPVFKDKKGFYLIRIDDIKGGQSTPLNEVWDQVKNAVVYIKQQQKLQELKDALSKKSKIEVYQEKVK